MPTATPPLPPYDPLRPRYFLIALAQIVAISILGVVLTAAVVRQPACPVAEAAHAR